MRLLRRDLLVIALILGAWLVGCSGESPTETSETRTNEASLKTSPVVLESDSTSVSDALAGGRFKPGEKFPFRRVVEQKLVQDSLKGPVTQVETRLELQLTVSVLDRIDDQSKLNVECEEVKYSQQIGEEFIEYDSSLALVETPDGLLPYRTLVGSQLQFWMNSSNEIVSVDGFDEYREAVSSGDASSQLPGEILGLNSVETDEDIVAYISELIGLLPCHDSSRQGDQWVRTQQISQPVPMHATTKYEITDVDDDVAQVQLKGNVIPAKTPVMTDEQAGVQVTVTGGETIGTTTVLRKLGLPTRRDVTQEIHMVVTMSNTLQFQQTKQIRTTMESLSASETMNPLAKQGLNAASREQSVVR